MSLLVHGYLKVEAVKGGIFFKPRYIGFLCWLILPIFNWHNISINDLVSGTLYCCKQSAGGKMGRMRENPRYNVISMRISDEERETLQEIMQSTKKSVSDIMREAMVLLKNELSKPQMENRAA